MGSAQLLKEVAIVSSKVSFLWYKHRPFVSVLDVLIVHKGGIQLVLESTPLSFEIDTFHVITRFGMLY